jgi:hypothetical protein
MRRSLRSSGLHHTGRKQHCGTSMCGPALRCRSADLIGVAVHIRRAQATAAEARTALACSAGRCALCRRSIRGNRAQRRRFDWRLKRDSCRSPPASGPTRHRRSRALHARCQSRARSHSVASHSPCVHLLASREGSRAVARLRPVGMAAPEALAAVRAWCGMALLAVRPSQKTLLRRSVFLSAHRPQPVSGASAARGAHALSPSRPSPAHSQYCTMPFCLGPPMAPHQPMYLVPVGMPLCAGAVGRMMRDAE